MAQSNSISIFVKSQVPDFWNRDGEELVNFIKVYYEWLQQFENPIQVSRKLADYKDADLIPDKYFQFMRNEFMKSIPVTLVDDRLLLKNIVDFYRARGTEKAYNMLFRILYGDENVSYYYPGKDILRASDGKWVIERSLKLNLNVPLSKIEDVVVIRGASSNATARKDKFISYVVNEVQTNEFYINNIFGTFEINEGILDDNTGEQLGFVTDLVTYPGGWIGTDGFLSSNKYLEDNFFYQEYSYQIRSSHAISEYESIANQLVHPAGTKLFGAVDMLASADFSEINLSLLSNLENVGDISKITISYELILNETAINATSNCAAITWVTQAGTQQAEMQNTIGFWNTIPVFQQFGNFSLADLSKTIVFRSNVPSFTMSSWTPIKILDTTHSANTYYFPQYVVNNTVLILSAEYQYGNTAGLHYQLSTSQHHSSTFVTEANDTILSAAKLALKGTSSITESVDTVASAALSGSDPYFSNVVFLAGFNGTNGATSTTDESLAGHTPLTFNGNAKLDTTQFKFGVSSAAFDGSGDYISIPDSADWQLSTSNSDQYTIEFWMMPHDTGSSIPYVMGQTTGGWAWYIDYNLQRPSFAWSSDGSNFQSLGSGAAPSISVDNWHFIAISKNSSGKIRLWRDGTLVASATPANSAIFNSTGPLEIGRSLSSAIYNGWLDEIRITKGICRYDTDGSITVPTAAFPRT
jgi:hypothetical protein